MKHFVRDLPVPFADVRLKVKKPWLFFLPENQPNLFYEVSFIHRIITMSGLWARYNKLLEAQPLLTKCLTSLTGFTAGDILAQNFVENDGKPYDIMRTVRLGSFGFLIHGSTGHFFYGFLDSKLPGTKPITVASKVFIDQTIWNPIFGCMFFGYLNLVEGKSWDDYVKKLQADLKTAVMGSWAVWVPAHTINFAFVPPSQRLLYINTIQIGYNVFLSFLGNKSVDTEEKISADAASSN
ncbi:Mpv17 / PMP22 family protein [Nitzschia inconspicua]|uniref:Mpv17 / PMP22 family protein n=1 Tax=Nitzschia inconspicua TaxID=303405 RepID=A0A9K3PHU7_9STRA|nr:Mpv17 / PMP22 family protein [Nitzschia inconspicua]